MDRQRVWRDVSYRFDQLLESAPDGYEPVVHVFLVGRDEPVAIAFVETSRKPEYPWVVLQAVSPRDSEGSPRSPDDYLVYVPESLIARVEITYTRKRGRSSIGFGVGEVTELAVAEFDS